MRTFFVAFAVLLLAAPVFAGTIDFESTGVAVGAPLPTIDIVSFDGAILGDYLGGASEGFISNAAGTFDALYSYAGVGEYFLADALGGANGTDFGVPVTVTATFSRPVTNVNMWISDVNQNFLEWVTVVISDGGGFTDTITLTEASPGGGDGNNAFLDFGNTTPITSMVITSGAHTSRNRAGWGLDNLSYSVVPLPTAAWAGLGLLGLLAGSRRLRRSR